MTDTKGPCGACGAIAGEECNPLCLGVAAQADAEHTVQLTTEQVELVRRAIETVLGENGRAVNRILDALEVTTS